MSLAQRRRLLRPQIQILGKGQTTSKAMVKATELRGTMRRFGFVPLAITHKSYGKLLSKVLC